MMDHSDADAYHWLDPGVMLTVLPTAGIVAYLAVATAVFPSALASHFELDGGMSHGLVLTALLTLLVVPVSIMLIVTIYVSPLLDLKTDIRQNISVIAATSIPFVLFGPLLVIGAGSGNVFVRLLGFVAIVPALHFSATALEIAHKRVLT